MKLKKKKAIHGRNTNHIISTRFGSKLQPSLDSCDGWLHRFFILVLARDIGFTGPLEVFGMDQRRPDGLRGT